MGEVCGGGILVGEVGEEGDLFFVKFEDREDREEVCS